MNQLFLVKKRGFLLLFWYKFLEAHFCLFWFWTSQNRITTHGFMYLENRDFGNKFGWYLGRYLEFFTKKVIWKYPFVKFIWSRITNLVAKPKINFPKDSARPKYSCLRRQLNEVPGLLWSSLISIQFFTYPDHPISDIGSLGIIQICTEIAFTLPLLPAKASQCEERLGSFQIPF